MSGPSWLVDSTRIATKIRSASEACDLRKVNWKSNPTRACPHCNYIIDNTDVSQEWPGLPRGVKFDPSDQEIIWHLLSKVGLGDAKPHPFIEEFIPTVEEVDGICYTHPQNLPGVKQDGSVCHFFHRAIKAYNTGTRKRRKIHGDDQGDVRWHKTGRTKPVILDGVQRGCKKIMVLYMSTAKGGKAEKTNWVMHQYHLGTGEDEKDGQFVVSKVFYQQQAKAGDKIEQDMSIDASEDTVRKVDPVTPQSVIHDPPRTQKQHSDVDCGQEPALYSVPSVQDPVISNSEDGVPVETEMLGDHNNHTAEDGERHMADASDDKTAEDPKWWEGDSQLFLDSQQLEGLSLCGDLDSQQLHEGLSLYNVDDLLQSQSQEVEGEGNKKQSRPYLADYSHIGAETLKKDLEECQKLDGFDPGNGGEREKAVPHLSDHALVSAEDLKQDALGSQNNALLDPLNIGIDTPPDFRLSQLEFGSQDSFLNFGV